MILDVFTKHVWPPLGSRWHTDQVCHLICIPSLLAWSFRMPMSVLSTTLVHNFCSQHRSTKRFWFKLIQCKIEYDKPHTAPQCHGRKRGVTTQTLEPDRTIEVGTCGQPGNKQPTIQQDKTRQNKTNVWNCRAKLQRPQRHGRRRADETPFPPDFPTQKNTWNLRLPRGQGQRKAKKHDCERFPVAAEDNFPRYAWQQQQQ